MRKLFWLLVCAIVMASCGESAKEGDKTQECSQIDILGMWDVYEIGGMKIEKAVDMPWIEFREEGLFGATVGCNGIFGKYEMTGNVLKIGETGRTEMYCEDMMELEDSLRSQLWIGDEMTVTMLDDSTLDITGELSGKHLLLKRSSDVKGID